jgi:hypothetical protein
MLLVAVLQRLEEIPQAVDHLVAAVQATVATGIPDWPRVREGSFLNLLVSMYDLSSREVETLRTRRVAFQQVKNGKFVIVRP